MSQNLSNTTHIFSGNYTFIEEIYKRYIEDPSLVSDDWKSYFAENHDDINDDIQDLIRDSKGASWSKKNLKVVGSQDFDISSFTKKEVKKSKNISTQLDNLDFLKLKVLNLITSYENLGHFAANLDPLSLSEVKYPAQIKAAYHGINDEDLEKEINLNGVLGFEKVKIYQIIDRLDLIFKSSVGAEYKNINNDNSIEWINKNLVETLTSNLDNDEKIKILTEIVRTTKFEQFLHKRFPGAKRFSVEGGESSINVVEKIIDQGAKSGIKKIVIGMAHRGRLNTLNGIMGKPYHRTMSEFKYVPDIPESITKLGDVKYHMGYANTRKIAGNEIDLSLAFNPSHLEAVNSVVMGRIRAKQDLFQDQERSQALALLVHGDAAFAGQGSVAETLMMSGIAGYDTGGVIHLIVNNQIGFTANPTDSRSTNYASDLAKAIDAPIFHVNGDDVEAVVKISDLALRYRQEFKKDVVIDLICYRKYGHNEGDEPMYTQPVMYSKIKNHPNLEKIYSDNLKNNSVISDEEYKNIVAKFNSHLEKEFEIAQNYKAKEADWLKKSWSHIKNGDLKTPITAISADQFKDLGQKITHIPDNFNINPKIARQIAAKRENLIIGKNIDWGTAEALAFTSLLNEDYPVRITGQDVGRGTFSHRHSVYHDSSDGSRYYPYNNISAKAKYEVHDSILSEYAVLGFEYGYSLSTPDGLTIWEGQFGDFANGAQIIFDQFICSSEEKWLRKSNLVMLLPHGFEGQGPEHSSARLERHLQSCANDNMFVVNITTPANFFHALRRQLHLKDRKPLIVMSPKSLLRSPYAVSNIEDFTGKTQFKEVIAETDKIAANDKVKKVVLCSGKIYYDLLAARKEKKINDIALIRLEQIYPFASDSLEKELKKYNNAQIIWCQEEPKNMGSWSFVNELIEESLINIKHKNSRPKLVSRVASASPATGYANYHAKEQKALIELALS